MRMTFEELNDTMGAAEIYSGTTVDSATQGALLEWLFDRYLSMSEHEPVNTWLRRYRRQLNMLYPIYQDYLRVEAVRSNMDPFITEFIERVHENEGTATNSGSSTKQTSGSDSGQDRTVTDNTNVRTPDLTTESESGNVQNNNLRDTSTNTDSGTVTASHSEQSVGNGKNRGMSIEYPEANMGSIPQDIDSFPSSINYAAGEQDSFSRSTNQGSSSDSESRNLVQSGGSTHTGTVTDTGNSTVNESGTDTNKFDGIVTRNNSATHTTSETDTNNGESRNRDKGQEIEQGRHESPADLLPRAISAITSTNSIKWLVKNILVCFDNYEPI